MKNPRASGNYVSSYPLDDDLILLDQRTQRIFVLNDTAAFLWSGLEAGLTASEVAAEISRRTAAPLPDAQRDCESLVAEWTAAGLIGAGATAAPTAAERRCYRVVDFGFRVIGPPDTVAAVDELLNHLSVDPGSLPADAPTLTITATADGWALSVGGRELGRCESREQLVPLVHANVLFLTYESSECLMAIHGAAVSRGATSVLLPGLPGHGKSTLAAALLAEGYDFCTDDLAMLAGRPLRLTPLPLRLGLKSGSWPVLRDRIPGLDTLPTHLRADGQHVKYWLPRQERVPWSVGERSRVAAIVFPRRRPGTQCALRPIARSQALLGISESGYHLLDGKLDKAWMELTLEWVSTLSCFELDYSNLDQAVAAFAEVLP